MATDLAVSSEQALAELNQSLARLVERGKKIEVKDQTTDLEAKQFKVEVKSYEKAVDCYCDPDIQPLKEKLSKLQAAKKMLLAPVQAVLDMVEKKRRAWEEQERQKAEKSSEKMSEKSGQQVEVKPNIPTLEGTRSGRCYPAEVVDPDVILNTWADARRGRTNEDKKYAAYLRQFILVDEQKIRQEARDLKDPQELMHRIPGVKAWTE